MKNRTIYLVPFDKRITQYNLTAEEIFNYLKKGLIYCFEAEAEAREYIKFLRDGYQLGNDTHLMVAIALRADNYAGILHSCEKVRLDGSNLPCLLMSADFIDNESMTIDFYSFPGILEHQTIDESSWCSIS